MWFVMKQTFFSNATKARQKRDHMRKLYKESQDPDAWRVVVKTCEDEGEYNVQDHRVGNDAEIDDADIFENTTATVHVTPAREIKSEGGDLPNSVINAVLEQRLERLE